MHSWRRIYGLSPPTGAGGAQSNAAKVDRPGDQSGRNSDNDEARIRGHKRTSSQAGKKQIDALMKHLKESKEKIKDLAGDIKKAIERE